MADKIGEWVIEAPETWKWGAEWIVRAHKPSPTPIKRRYVAATFPVIDAPTAEAAIARALPALRRKIAEQENLDRLHYAASISGQT